ncbi:MAG: HAMP domain-containing histidine kinase [Magnetococcales bacterium]|nr:HAMP domain-containing histidine kinase [Magnetococcales bacterium]
MRRRYNLRIRVAWAFATFGAMVCLLMGGFQLLATHDLSQRLIDETLTAELDDFLSRRERNPQSLPPNTVVLHGYVQAKGASQDDIPKYLNTLPPGRHNLTVGRLAYRVAVVDHREERYFFLYDTSLQQKREQRSIIFIVVSMIIVGFVSALGGIWLVRVIIAPVTELANRIRNRRPDVWTLQWTDDFGHDEVGELARAFDLHLGYIHALAERERAFTSDLSHELRTSLAVILNAAEILLADEHLPEKQKTRILRIERAAHDMTETGNALLFMSRQQHALRMVEEVCVAEVIDEAVEKHRLLLKDKPIALTLSTDPQLRINADRGLLHIVAANLIRNAFTYTQQGEVKIVQDHASFAIIDSGQGMDPRQIQSSFQRQWRVFSHIQGTGIGLSLVKRICDQYGWTLKIASERGTGTRVEIFFSLTDN